jgi:Rho-binding antiterminator
MISCNAYDYIEIACMYRLHIRLIAHSGEVYDGVALDTTRTDDNQEAILLEQVHGAIKIPLVQVHYLEAITHNPHFTKVDISGELENGG